MKSTPLYYLIDPNKEIEITLRLREYNGIDSDPAVLVREPSFPEAIALASKLKDREMLKLTLHTEFPYDEVPVAAVCNRPAQPSPLDWKEETQPLHP